VSSKATELQAKQHELYAMWWHARIVSGDYKRSERRIWNETYGEYTQMSEAELLQYAVETMECHIKLYAQCIESLASL